MTFSQFVILVNRTKPLLKMDYYKLKNFLVIGAIAVWATVGTFCYIYLVFVEKVRQRRA